MGKIDIGRAFSKGWEGFSSNVVNLIIGTLLMAVISITVILAPIMMAGFMYMILKAVRGEQVEVNDVFKGFSDFGRYFVAGLLLLGINIVGMLACGIGIIVTGALSLFVFPLMIDRGIGAGEALGLTWEHFKSDWLMLIVITLVTGAISSVGTSIFGLGWLVTSPFASAVAVAAYLDVFGEAIPATPVAPEANITI